MQDIFHQIKVKIYSPKPMEKLHINYLQENITKDKMSPLKLDITVCTKILM